MKIRVVNLDKNLKRMCYSNILLFICHWHYLVGTWQELIKMTTSQKEKDDLCDAVESMRDVVKYVNNILHQVSITGFDVCMQASVN